MLLSKVIFRLDEVFIQWIEKIKHQKNSAMMTRFSISITPNIFHLEPLQIDLVYVKSRRIKFCSKKYFAKSKSITNVQR